MSKRWAAWPRGIQWLVWIAVVVLALAIVWALFVPLADWLAQHDVGSVGGPLHETALDNARGRLLTLGAGLFAAGALVFTARNFTVSRRTFELTEQGQVTDRYTKAIEQLGSDKLDVRIGGIYALERIARDSKRDHPTVMDVVSAFVREHSHEPWPPSDPGGREQARSIRPDVQAALTVVGRRDPERDIRPIDLVEADLYGVNLGEANLTRVILSGANLTGAYLASANLASASLSGANLTSVDLTTANLTDAYLANADLTSGILRGANLTNADLGGRDTSAEDFYDDSDESIDLFSAQVVDTDLTGAQLDGAYWPRRTAIPVGWRLDADTRRLRRAAPLRQLRRIGGPV